MRTSSIYDKMPGKRFGKWTVLTTFRPDKGKTRALVLCDCGTMRHVLASNLSMGESKSCGCFILLNKHKIKHGMASPDKNGKRKAEYQTWCGMRARCHNKKCKEFRFYGAKGVSVCKRWDSFSNFYSDMGDRPTNKHSIDRIDPSGNYEPGNCRWATNAEQGRNKRNSIYITIQGETKTINEWAERLKKSAGAIRARMHRGMSPMDAVLYMRPPKRG